MEHFGSPQPNLIDSVPDNPRRSPKRFWLLKIIIVGLCGILIGRAFYLQVVIGSRFRVQAENNHVTVVPLPAPRGLIYDIHGVQLTENITSTDVVIDPAGLTLANEDERLIATLKDLGNLSENDVRQALAAARGERRSITAARAIPHETVLKIEQQLPQLPGVRLAASAARKYLHSNVSAHTLGYVSPVSSEEIKENPRLTPQDQSGKNGVEKKYDELLRGINGALYQEVDAKGVAQKELSVTKPIVGADLNLALDIELQKYIYLLFEERAQEKNGARGAVVALDPRSGAVRALVSFPSYDPNLFSQPALRDQLPAVFQTAGEPLFNRTADGMYPPGSTIKPFLALAALNEGIISAETEILSTGGISIGQWSFPDWKTGGHGRVTLRQALAESVNTYFYLAVGGYQDRPGLGMSATLKYLDLLGFGRPTRLDLPSEASGFLPTPEWKKRAKGEAWYIGDTYHLAIGQGDILVTPLQLATATAAMATNGWLKQPHLVESHKFPGGELTPTLTAQQKIDLPISYFRAVQEGMREAVLTGSARLLTDVPLPLAGKTGTAQTGRGDTTHAWLTSYGPFEQPELVVVVLLEEGGEGDKDAVPLAKKIWQWWYDHSTGRAVSSG